jgi:hypothetical protein
MLFYLTVFIGALIAGTGILLFAKGIGRSGTSTLKIFGAELQTGSSALIIFIAGAALIGLAVVNGSAGEKEAKPADDKSVQPPENIVVTPPAGAEEEAIDEKKYPETVTLVETTLTAGQQQVLNAQGITVTLQEQSYSDTSGTIRIRIWRRINNPFNDTAVVDAIGTADPGESFYYMRMNQITPVNIPDVGTLLFYPYQPLVEGGRLLAVHLKINRG